MENNKNKKSVKFQGDMLKFCDFIQVFVFTRNHHLKPLVWFCKVLINFKGNDSIQIICNMFCINQFISLSDINFGHQNSWGLNSDRSYLHINI